MGRRLETSGVALVALVATVSATVAAPRCAKPAEVTAIQVAAIQQELMVAALTCNDVTQFNAFQTGYSSELRHSDRSLRAMFRRIFGSRGESQYHAFKTRLANNSSMRSIHDNRAYCQEAQQVFGAALASGKPTLASFVSGVAVHDSGPVDSCDMRVATTMSGAKGPPSVVPKPNPMRVATLVAAPADTNAPVADVTAAPAAQPTPAAETAPVQTAAQGSNAKADKPAEKKKSGWLSSIFD